MDFRHLPVRTVRARLLFSSTSALSIVPAEFSFANIAAYSPARFPKTIRSDSEFPPKRFAPFIPAAHSPAAKSPGTVEACVSLSTRMPPIM